MRRAIRRANSAYDVRRRSGSAGLVPSRWMSFCASWSLGTLANDWNTCSRTDVEGFDGTGLVVITIVRSRHHRSFASCRGCCCGCRCDLKLLCVSALLAGGMDRDDTFVPIDGIADLILGSKLGQYLHILLESHSAFRQRRCWLNASLWAGFVTFCYASASCLCWWVTECSSARHAGGARP